MKISIIAAMDHDRVIGINNRLPWHLPDDLQHFKIITLGKSIIMGRKTFESIGKALPKRRNIVLSRQSDFSAPGIEIFDSLEAALQACKDEEEVVIIGGENLYQQAKPFVTHLYLTLVDTYVKGDAFFPEWDLSAATLLAECEHPADENHAYSFRFLNYQINKV